MSANELNHIKITKVDHNATRRFKRKACNPKKWQKEQEKMKQFQEDFLKAKDEVVQELRENGFTVIQHTK